MLTDTKLRNLKPEAKAYKVSDRDGLYVTVLTTGTVRSAITTASTDGKRRW